MKRDKELARKILEYARETITETTGKLTKFEGYTDAEVYYHIDILQRHGYLIGLCGVERNTKKPVFTLGSPTWAGHDYLESLEAE
jgi:hypothetical protein